MQAGERWFRHRPAFQRLKKGHTFWHVFPSVIESGGRVDPTSANPNSRARFALHDTHGMFYLGDSLTGVLFETVLRWIEPEPDGAVEIPLDSIRGMRAVELELMSDQVDHFPLIQPHLKKFRFGPSTAMGRAIVDLIHEPDHEKTHAASAAIRDELARYGLEMPVLSWMSRQHSPSQVYLAYEPPMNSGWWRVKSTVICLDDEEGHDRIRLGLEKCGFHWVPSLYDPQHVPKGPADRD